MRAKKKTKAKKENLRQIQPALSEKGIDKRIVYALSFLLPFLCTGIMYAVFGMYPFGDKTMLVMDLNGEYIEYLSWLRRVFTGDESLIYSFTKEMGGNTFGLFAFYISSPFYLLTIIFPQLLLPEGFALMTLVKIGVSGLTFAVFARNVYKRCDLSITVFAMAYAMSVYSIHYSMCSMWIDGVIWLPLILLGMEKIMDGDKPWLFMAAYTMSLVSNYYTGYMSTIFAVMYFAYRYAVRDGEKSVKDCMQKIAALAISGAVSVLMALFLILPPFLNIFTGKLSGATYKGPDTFFNTNIFKIPRRLFIGQYDSITNNGTPNIFCGIICGLMTGAFFFNKNIKLKEKIAAACVYAVMIVSFFVLKIDVIWHVMQYPNWYPYRYAYVFCFFSAMTAYRGFIKADEKSANGVIIGMLVYAVLVLTVFLADKKALTNMGLARLSLGFVVVYGAAVWLVVSGKLKLNKNIIYGVIAVLTATEMTVNGFATIKGLNGEFKYVTKTDYTQKIERLKGAVDYIQAQDDGLYRIERTIERTDNDSMSIGYNGMTHYSSTYNGKLVSFNQRMGMLQEYILIRYAGSTMVTDSLLGIKYVISDKKIAPDYESIHKENGADIYKNPYALGFGFAADKDALEPIKYTNSKLYNQGLLARKLLGESYMEMQNAEIFVSEASRAFTASMDGLYYMELKNKYKDVIKIAVNGEPKEYEYDKSEKKIFCLGEFKAGDRVEVSLKDGKAADGLVICGLDNKAFGEACTDKRENGGMEISEYGKKSVEGRIELKKDEVLVTSIPYEDGWTAYVDGEKRDVLTAVDTFIAVDAGEGEHEIRLVYHAPGLALSCTVSGLTLLCVTVFAFRKKIKAKLKK